MTLPRFVQDDNGPFRALKHYNFRVFWFGQLLSLVGSWMQGIAQSWLILVLADPASSIAVLHNGGNAGHLVNNASAATQAIANRYQGEVNFWNGFPVLLLTLFAGVMIDRVNKRRVIIVTQLGFLACALAMGILIHTGAVRVPYIMLLAGLVGLFMAFDMPTRQSFVVEIVGKRDVPSAVALNSSMFNAARSIGPGVAGLLLTYFSIATVFFLNAASYVVVIASLLLMRGKTLGNPTQQTAAQTDQGLWENLKEGFQFVWGNHTARNIVLLVGSLGTFAFSFNVLIPTFVRYHLLPHATNAEQVQAFGYLESVRGVGALCAAIAVAVLSRVERYKWNLIIGGLLSNALLMAFAWERNMALAYVTMALVTFGFVLIFATANTVMQMTIPDNLRGRVMSIYVLVFIGTGPIGALMAGYIAQYVGAPWTIFAFALVSLICVAVVSFRPGGMISLSLTHMTKPNAAKATTTSLEGAGAPTTGPETAQAQTTTAA